MIKKIDLRAAFSKFFIPLAVVIFVLFSFSVTTSAEITSVEFTMEEDPVFIDEKTTDQIVEFYANATRAELFSSETNTFVKRKITLEEKKPSVEKNAVVHTFKITDIDFVDTDNVSEFVSDIVENIFIELTSNLGKKYVSTLIYMYGASYEVTYDPETGSVTEMLLHIALVVGDDFDQVDNLIATIIKPKADEWREYPAAKQIIELNNYILDGHLQYDIKGTQRKSTVQFVAHGKGVCEEYAGLTALFLDELGFENMLVRGYAVVDKENVEHVWNLVNIDGAWYHLDILWNGPIDEKGSHTDITADYLLKSAKTFKKDHLTLAVYYSDSEKATADYDLSEYIYNGDIVTPQMKLDIAREALSEAIDAAFDVCFRYSSKYTVDSVNRMTPVYDAAKKVYNDESATVEQIDAETEKVKNALAKYVVVFQEADKSKLYKSLSQAYECMLYDFALYTAESVKALSAPYEAAVAVYQNKYATQKEVDNARSNLKKVLNKLEKIVVEEPEVEVVPDTGTQTPDTTTPVVPDNTTDTPIVVTPVTPLPDETIPELGQNPTEEDVTGEEIESEEIGETPADALTPEETPDEDVSEEEITEEEDTSSDENIPTEEETVPEESPENNVEENGNNEEEKPVVTPPAVTPSEPSAIDTDIIIYAVGALIALGGIIYLIVSKIRSGSDDAEDEDGSEEENVEKTSSEEPAESSENVEDAKAEEVKAEETEVPEAVAPVVEEKTEEKTEEAKEEDVKPEENSEEKKEEASDEQAKTDEVKEENKETEASAEAETSEKAEEVKTSEDKSESSEAVIVVAEEKEEEKKTEETAEVKAAEEVVDTAAENTEPAVEISEASEASDEKESSVEATEEKSEDVKEETEATPASEEKTETAEENTEVKTEEISHVEKKNQEKASRLLNYFSAKNEKLKKKEKADK